jgi:quercetin dioxygenase-like cupin family protein
MTDNGMKGFSILKNNNFNAVLIRFEPNTTVRKDFLPPKSSKFIYVLKGPVSVVLDGKKSVLRQGDAAYFKEIFPSEWKTEGGDKAEILLLSS